MIVLAALQMGCSEDTEGGNSFNGGESVAGACAGAQTYEIATCGLPPSYSDSNCLEETRKGNWTRYGFAIKEPLLGLLATCNVMEDPPAIWGGVPDDQAELDESWGSDSTVATSNHDFIRTDSCAIASYCNLKSMQNHLVVWIRR
jgi:hypothetical protein